MCKKDEKSLKWARALAWVSVGSGGLILLIFVVLLLFGKIYPSSDFDPQLTGIVGDFIGGIVGSLWALAGVFFFFWALLYQRRDLNLQSELLELQRREMETMGKELEVSNQNQKLTLEQYSKQTKLITQQKTNTLIFGQIDSFNAFKERSNYVERIDKVLDYWQRTLAERWKIMIYDRSLYKDDINKGFAHYVKVFVNRSIKEMEDYYFIKRYVQMAYNAMFYIDSCNCITDQDYFRSLFLSQLSTPESILLRLSNLMYLNMPMYSSLPWEFDETQEIVDWLKKYENIFVKDFEQMNTVTLTEIFKELQHS